MFHHSLDDEVEKRIFVKWYLLAFLAGNVNAGGFLAAGKFVSHITGFATLFGVGVADGHYDQAAGILAVPAFFLAGVMISAFLIDHRFHKGLRPHYDWVMLLQSISLILAAVLGHYHFFGIFGDAQHLKENFVLLSLLCLACGLQNGAITTATGASVRTTHLTGLTTDLGIGLIRVWGMPHSGKDFRQEVRSNWLRIGTIMSFAMGSVAGAALFVRFHYLGFLLPAAIALYAMTQGRKHLVHPHTG
ncbi:MAG: YoaK family protein [Bdellovibrionota bacterium]